jgi:mono/diheme cytochrome c family protein
MRHLTHIAAATVFLALIGAPARAEVAAGKQAFEANKCAACHYTKGPAKEKSIADQLAKKGPELWYAGSKFRKKWLAKWLENPVPIRPMAYNSVTEKNPGDHPKLKSGDAQSITDYLMSLTSNSVKAGVIKPKKSAKGRLIFTKKMPCSGCHQFPTKKKYNGGMSAPSLVGAKKRLNPDWIYAYLKKPKIFKPVKAMPVFTGILRDKDMKAVAAYVANFK